MFLNKVDTIPEELLPFLSIVSDSKKNKNKKRATANEITYALDR